ncbi:MAG: hypothetical protein Q9186_005191 [Xanthomendoza sp. 1 TL-2023]
MASAGQSPAYGRRLLPSILDEDAQLIPERIFAAIPNSADVRDGFQNVVVARIATAVNYLAYQLQSAYGVSLAQEHETLTYIGVPDLRYNLIFYAAVKCGYKVLLPSPRNPLPTILSLMEQTESSKLVYSEEVAPLIAGLRSARPDLRFWVVGALSALLAVESPHFPYQHEFDEVKHHPILVLHSSGSTGLPKPVTMTHGTFAVIDNDRNFPSVPGRKNHDLTVWDFHSTDARIYEPFPPFHLAGFFNKITVPLFTHTIPIFGPPSRPPSGALVAEIMRQERLHGLFLPPIVAEQLLQEENGISYFQNLDVFCYAGGPLSQTTGDAISAVTTVCQFYGSTELGQIRQLVPEHGDWSYMEFHPHSKLEFQPAEDNAYELVVFADSDTEGNAALNHNYPGVKEWKTRDLFRAHPTKKGLWKFYGRRDDILVLSSGEKFNPVPAETTLQQHPSVAGALIVGQGRSQPALLVEPVPKLVSFQAILDDIWPLVEQENLKSPSHGRIAKSLVLVTKSERPFVRAGKGTVVRKLTEKAYETDIDELFEKSFASSSIGSVILRAPKFDPTTVSDFVILALGRVLPNVELTDNDNLYSFGLDSLRTREFVQILKASLGAYRQQHELSWITMETIYRNPTIQDVSREVLTFLNEGTVSAPIPRETAMSTMLEELIKELSPPVSLSLEPFGKAVRSIVLTGSTGWLGMYLLETLLAEPDVEHIWCLNRSTEAYQQWQNHAYHLARRGQTSARLTFLTVDYKKEFLGLGSYDLQKIKEEVDLIIHNAWKVNFNEPLISFAENLRSVRTLANISATGSCRPHLVFISSISSCGPWGPSIEHGAEIPEAAVTNLDAALAFGYGESKMVAERLLDAASRRHGIRVSVLRIGQIAGPSEPDNSSWPDRDVVVAMLKTSKSIGLVPDNLPDVDWIPIDKISKIIVEISVSTRHDKHNSPEYFNIVNPYPVPWGRLLNPVERFCGSNARLVPLAEWLAMLQSIDNIDAQKRESMPALRTLRFFVKLDERGAVAKYHTSASQCASGTMALLEPVSVGLMDVWLQQIRLDNGASHV